VAAAYACLCRFTHPLKIIHALWLLGSFPIPVDDLSIPFIEGEAFQGQKRADPVFVHAFSLFSVSGSDFAVNIESSMPPGENLLHKGETDVLFPKQQGEDLMGEDLADALIMEAGDMVEGAIWVCAPLNCQDMDVGVEIDSIPEGLDQSHHSWHQLPFCNELQVFQESFKNSMLKSAHNPFGMDKII